MLPSAHYQQRVEAGELTFDARQADILKQFDTIHTTLTTAPHSWLKRLWHKSTPLKGLYLWGQVGIGKTMMMDLFYNNISINDKQRLHYLEFMRLLQQEMRQLQGKAYNPILQIAEKIAKKTRLLCLDEMFVNDTGDAMILAQLIPALFAKGVVFITSSNCEPDALYSLGFQRERFAPVIKLLKNHCHVIHLNTQDDYRLRHLEQAGTYYTPLNHSAEQQMQKAFKVFAGGASQLNHTLTIMNRPMPTRACGKNIAWFDFSTLCVDARSQQDYLDIAAQFSTLLISDIPQIPEHKHDWALRFILLIDVLYDQHIQLIASAAAPIKQLYCGDQLAFEFQRTHSRLIEMQSKQWFQETS